MEWNWKKTYILLTSFQGETSSQTLTLDLPPRTPVTNKGLGLGGIPWNSPTKKVLILVLTVTTTWVEW